MKLSKTYTMKLFKTDTMKLFKTVSSAAWGLLALAAMGLAGLGLAAPAQAQEPHYLAALHELRGARDYIVYDNRSGNDQLRHHAKEEIDNALNVLKVAAWDDGKSTDFSAAGANGPSWAPIHDAKHYLDMARAQVAQGVDSPGNNGLRGRALAHIDEAERTLDRIIRETNPR